MKRLQVLLGVVFAVATGHAMADDWPQWFGPQRDGVWREAGIVEKLPEGGPELVWKAAIGNGYAGPAVSDGRVYVFDRTLADLVEFGVVAIAEDAAFFYRDGWFFDDGLLQEVDEFRELVQAF